MLGELKNSQIEHLLYCQVIGRIGCYSENEVYVVPITYAYEDGYIYGHTREGKKIDFMRKNPNVCFEVDVVDNMSNWRSVISWGKFEELKDPKDREHAMRILLDRTNPILTGETTVQHSLKDAQSKFTEAMKGVVYRVKLTRKTGRYEKR